MQVEVEFLAAERGGRKSPVAPTGYRPLLRFEGFEQLVGLAELLFDGERWVAPGEVAQGQLRLAVPPEAFATPRGGDRFEILEGLRLVGHGTVVDP